MKKCLVFKGITAFAFMIVCFIPAVLQAASIGSKPVIQSQTPNQTNSSHPGSKVSVVSSQLAGTISVTHPVGNPLWVPGSTHTVKWKTTGYPGQHVKISLYRGNQFDRELVTSMPNSQPEGAFSWQVPANITQAENYTIQVQSVERPTIKASSIPIRIHGSIHITEPTQNTIWTPGTPQIIRWTYNGKPGQNVKIFLSESGKVAVPIIASTSLGQGNSGLAAWDIPESKSQDPTYFIQIQSIEYPFVKTISQPFKINGKITISSPVAGQQIYNGSSLNIQGQAFGCGPNVKVVFGYPTYAGGGAGFAFIELLNITVPVNNKTFSTSIPLSGLQKGGIHAVSVTCAANPAIKATSGALTAY